MCVTQLSVRSAECTCSHHAVLCALLIACYGPLHPLMILVIHSFIPIPLSLATTSLPSVSLVFFICFGF